LNCFVIMPFAQEFDDVYVAIKTGVLDGPMIKFGSPKCMGFLDGSVYLMDLHPIVKTPGWE
jgi:hypothetical protein